MSTVLIYLVVFFSSLLSYILFCFIKYKRLERSALNEFDEMVDEGNAAFFKLPENNPENSYKPKFPTYLHNDLNVLLAKYKAKHTENEEVQNLLEEIISDLDALEERA